MKFVFAIFFSFVLMVTSVGSSFAMSDKATIPDIPEKNGDYPDAANPGIRVRVFVHEPKQKDITTGTNAVCAADEDSISVVGATGWELPATNLLYYINKSSVPASVGGSTVQTIVENGFDSWTDSIASTSPKPNLIYGGVTNKNKSSYDKLNIIAWGRTSGSTLGVTYTRYSTTTGLVVDVDTIMNQKIAWTHNTCSATAYDVADILMHELGHWYGLDDEYTVDFIHNTMYGYGDKAENKKVTPTTGDIDGINLVYQ